jgi:hypothetical protein
MCRSSTSRRRSPSIRALLTGNNDVREVVHFRVLHIGPDDLLVEAELAFSLT